MSLLPTPCQEDIDRLELLDNKQLEEWIEKAMDEIWSEVSEIDPITADREAFLNGLGSLLILLWEAGLRIDPEIWKEAE